MHDDNDNLFLISVTLFGILIGVWVIAIIAEVLK